MIAAILALIVTVAPPLRAQDRPMQAAERASASAAPPAAAAPAHAQANFSAPMRAPEPHPTATAPVHANAAPAPLSHYAAPQAVARPLPSQPTIQVRPEVRSDAPAPQRFFSAPAATQPANVGRTIPNAPRRASMVVIPDVPTGNAMPFFRPAPRRDPPPMRDAAISPERAPVSPKDWPTSTLRSVVPGLRSSPAPASATSQPQLSRRDLIWDRRRPNTPRSDDGGRPLRVVPAVRPPATAPSSRPSWEHRIERKEHEEIARNTYFWHHDSGIGYVHYVDNWGDHWYGFPRGSSFYWLRRHSGRWWWHDPVGDRWLFWAGASWAWANPVTAETVYVEPSGDPMIAPSEPSQPSAPDVAPQPALPVSDAAGVEAGAFDAGAAEQTFYSDDHSRLIAIYGADRDALLFDSSGDGDPVYLAMLASGASDAAFFQSKPGEPLEIVLFMQDGSMQRFDGDGRPYESAQGAPSASAPPWGTQQTAVDAGLGAVDHTGPDGL